ncbi:hypothetical protein GVX82_04305 [Patescibacteria group bacterium]|jgi:DnaK suppressor protein|nr:hypothetical protein [Patescibacteria group bacterium]
MDTTPYQEALEAERVALEAQLREVGVQTEPGSGVWIPSASDLAVDQADPNEVADAAEESSEHVALVTELSARYRNVLRALKKIEEGTYGVDELDGEPIEEDRLHANPAARTRKANLEREDELEA